ncbi:MAG: hypothetical protein K2K21_06700, partial [Lachnospiraceae bacterium]|nr:hypothetical protein [Lachnospiraceae bacterium]
MKALKNSMTSEVQESVGQTASDILVMLEKQADGRKKGMEALQKAGSLSDREKRKQRNVIRFLSDCAGKLRIADMPDAKAAMQFMKECYDDEVASYRQGTQKTCQKLHYLFTFVEDTFGSGNEMLVLLTECTVNKDSAKFISMYGCEDYHRHNEEMMVSERGDILMQQIVELEKGMVIKLEDADT